MEESLKGLVFFYYTFSELFLARDYYYLNKLCQNMLDSDYSTYATSVLEHIHSGLLPVELELLENACLLERNHRQVDTDQLLKSYEHFG